MTMSINDASQWPSSFPELREIDNLLRCGVCYEIMNTALIVPSCSHNYCSLCIRKYMTFKTECPTCRMNVNELDLKNNRILDELITHFTSVRDRLLKALTDDTNGAEPVNSEKLEKGSTQQDSEPKPSRQSKRKRQRVYSDSNWDDFDSDESYTVIKSTVKRKKKNVIQEDENSLTVIDLVTETENSNQSNAVNTSNTSTQALDSMCTSIEKRQAANLFRTKTTPALSTPSSSTCSSPKLNRSFSDIVTPSTSKDTPTSAAKKVKCPVCTVPVTEKYINLHLDRCLNGPPAQQQRNTVTKRRKPLPKLVYNLMKDADIRKRLTEHGLPTQGDRRTLIKRHQEFTLFYNAECDSLNPKSAPEIVRDMQRSSAPSLFKSNTSKSNANRGIVLDKNAGQEQVQQAQKKYLKEHKSQFSELIAATRERMRPWKEELARKTKADVEDKDAKQNMLQSKLSADVNGLEETSCDSYNEQTCFESKSNSANSTVVGVLNENPDSNHTQPSTSDDAIENEKDNIELKRQNRNAQSPIDMDLHSTLNDTKHVKAGNMFDFNTVSDENANKDKSRCQSFQSDCSSRDIFDDYETTEKKNVIPNEVPNGGLLEDNHPTFNLFEVDKKMDGSQVPSDTASDIAWLSQASVIKETKPISFEQSSCSPELQSACRTLGAKLDSESNLPVTMSLDKDLLQEYTCDRVVSALRRNDNGESNGNQESYNYEEIPTFALPEENTEESDILQSDFNEACEGVQPKTASVDRFADTETNSNSNRTSVYQQKRKLNSKTSKFFSEENCTSGADDTDRSRWTSLNYPSFSHNTTRTGVDLNNDSITPSGIVVSESKSELQSALPSSSSEFSFPCEQRNTKSVRTRRKKRVAEDLDEHIDDLLTTPMENCNGKRRRSKAERIEVSGASYGDNSRKTPEMDVTSGTFDDNEVPEERRRSSRRTKGKRK